MLSTAKKKIAIIGGGTSALFLAAFLDTTFFEVSIYEKKRTLGRKFLVAGEGGFNLTHSEHLSDFKKRFTPLSFLEKSLDAFDNINLREWLADIGIPTFVGSSGRVFPVKGIKPISVLNAVEKVLEQKSIKIKNQKVFTGWNENDEPMLNSNDVIKTDYTIFALGGASWSVTGSDGSWRDIFMQKNIEVLPFRSSNCAFQVNWPAAFIAKFEGAPLKNIAMQISSKVQKGEAVITKFGLEGNAIYALSPEIQAQLSSDKKATVHIDFKPSFDEQTIAQKISSTKSNLSKCLREEIKISKAAVALLKSKTSKDEFCNAQLLSRMIKQCPLEISEAAPIDEVISTAGGISLQEVDSNFELNKFPKTFCVGEMLNWDAPTGGYLIQACASMGVHLARYLNQIHQHT